MNEEAYCMGIWLASILAAAVCGYAAGIGMMAERPASCKRLPDIDLGRYADEADEQARSVFGKTGGWGFRAYARNVRRDALWREA